MPRAARARPRADDDFHVSAEGLQKANEPFSGEPNQLVPQQRRDLRLVDAEHLGGDSLSQPLSSDDLRDLRRQLGLGKRLLRGLDALVSEHVAAAHAAAMAEIVRGLVNANILTPEEGRQLASDVFNSRTKSRLRGIHPPAIHRKRDAAGERGRRQGGTSRFIQMLRYILNGERIDGRREVAVCGVRSFTSS